MTNPISLEELNTTDAAKFAQRLGNIYEHATWVADSVWARRPFPTVQALYEAMQGTVAAADAQARMALVQNHPELGSLNRAAVELTDESIQEQKSTSLDREDGDLEKLRKLNVVYRGKFGFPFIVCVRRHTKASILRTLERRLGNETAEELRTALVEVDRIAALRLNEAVVGPGALRLDGKLSTHVLDTSSGRPAAGMTVELHELSSSGEPRLIVRATTNGDGRTDRALIEGRPVPAGSYELRFHVGQFYQKKHADSDPPSFLDVVPVRFQVTEPEARYHIPLLVTPWSYATYRGS